MVFDFISVTLFPVLFLLLLGWLLFHYKMLNEGFVESGAKIVFNLALPALLFFSISQADFGSTFDTKLLVIGVVGTVAYFLLLTLFSHFIVSDVNARGVVIQGGFRANMGIIGLAYCVNYYGSDGLAAASIYLGGITIAYNVLSVFILDFYRDGQSSIRQIIKSVATNPLIIGILLAVPFNYFQIPLPQLVLKTGEYLTQLTLPLALICTGASLQLRSFTQNGFNIVISTISKCLIYPAFMVLITYLAGGSGMSLGIVLLLTVAPSATVTYVMARNMGGDHRLAASIITVTTLISAPVTLFAFGLLSSMGLI
ncbi:AEC family transporter [Alteromonas ponticola]|uniref:AEC family transporter n=1 Tax=Alteromonas ponticola TaxID=2720613 RepID=A0ABX1R8C1_9ALTE|nr:AEC family transporter [Alteromonas ponticola]NMH61483.1 AEC family transporter [Alteromonas ponticola]